MKPSKLNIEQLVDRCRSNDQNAQLEIYNRYYKAMYNTAFRIIKNTAEAEDLMQEAFLTAFTKLHMLEDDKTFGAWLKKIVVNACITASRQRKNKNEISLDHVYYHTEDVIGVVEEETTTNSKIRPVLNALHQLKESYSTALTLHLIEGYDYEEMCQILDISYANCRTLISRAKESLRKKMQLA